MRTITSLAILSMCAAFATAATADAEQPVQRIDTPAAEPAPDPAPAELNVEPATEGPPGSSATFRVVVEHDYQETGVAVSAKDGLLVASGKVFENCPENISECTIRVGDPSGRVWLSATLVARDAANVIALVRTKGELPDAAKLEPRVPVKDEPAHAISYQARTLITYNGSIGGITKVTLPEKTESAKPKKVAVITTRTNCDTCTAGSPLFSSKDNRLLGIYIGAVTVGETEQGAFLPTATVQAFVKAHKDDDRKTK